MTQPLSPRPDVVDFLLTRRSRPAKTLTAEAPEPDEIRVMLTAASRTPDHGKLVPWRFVVISRDGMGALSEQASARMTARGEGPEQAEKAARNFTYGGLIVAVVTVSRTSPKIPLWEQEAAASSVCLALVNAALACGWGANWLSGPLCRDPEFLGPALGLAPDESVAGFVHIGRETVVPPDRDRPDIDTITTWR